LEKDFVLRRELKSALLPQGHLGECLPTFSAGTQRVLHPWVKEMQLPLELTAGLGIVHMMLVL
jgi:hypothetical protein